ncbi:MAG: cohesin domain-containing protein [Halobacteriota archaeon]
MGRSVLAGGIVICIVAAFISSLAILVPALAALQAEDTVKVTVNAPEYVNGTFNASIDVDNITDFNSGQFDLSFNSSVVNVTGVGDGEIAGETVPIFMWDFVNADKVRVLVSMPMGVGLNGSGHLAEVEFGVRGEEGDRSKLDISGGLLVDTEAKEIEVEWYHDEVTVKIKAVVFDTGEGTYPSIFGTHEGTITPAKDISVHKMYTYPCTGTGGHSEYVRIWNATLDMDISATWKGYTGNYHNIVFHEPFTLSAGETYNYTIRTGSYPLVHHTEELELDGGMMRCTKFTDANGRTFNDWILAMKLW